jgi:hypothetical protein
METNSLKKIGLWLDQSHAILVGCDNGEAFVLEEMDSPVKTRVRYPGEVSDMTRFGTALGGISNNENKKNNTYNNQISKYFQELINKVKDMEEIFLIGPGVIKNQFLKQINSDKKFASTQVKVQDADKMTTNQLLALVKEHFHKKNNLNK